MRWSEPAPTRLRQRLRIKRWDYYGVTSWRDDGEVIQIDELVGLVAQHHARWRPSGGGPGLAEEQRPALRLAALIMLWPAARFAATTRDFSAHLCYTQPIRPW